MTLGLVDGAFGQVSPCLSQADSVAEYHFATSLVFGRGDSVATVAAGYPWASKDNIQSVTDSATCAAGVAAFNQITRRTGTPKEQTAAYIFSLGGTGYAYIRPSDKTAGMQHIYLFSPSWVFVATMVS